MRLNLTIPTLLLIGACAWTADTTAPPADAAKLAKADALVASLKLDAQLATMTAQSFSSMLGPMKKQLPAPMLAQLQSAENEVNAYLVKQLDWAKIKPEIVAAYANAYSDKELADLTTFYASPLGQHVITATPVMNQALAQRSQDCIAAAMPEIQKIMQKAMGGAEAKSAEDSRASVGIEAGKPFPAIASTTFDGKPFDLAGWKGKVVLVDFWATWCGPCVGELPNVKAAYDKFHDKGFEIVGISLDDNKDKLTKFLASKKVTWPQLFDGKGWQNEFAQKFEIKSIPATFLIGKDGNLIEADLRGEALTAAVEKALK